MHLLNFLKNKICLFKGWLELILKQDYHYKYFIERIELKSSQNKPFSMIHYKLIGCRKLITESAIELNKLSTFSLFRPDHAQIIVSIATAEALIGQSTDQISNSYQL
jgi:hypothetical protein